MKANLLRLFKRFWLLGALSLFSIFFAFQIIANYFFPTFISNVCVGGTGCDWGLLDGYASLATLAILIGGLVFTVWEYSRQESQLSFQIYESIHAKMTDPSEEAARRWIYHNIGLLEGDITKEQWLKKTSNEIHHKPENWLGEIAPGHQNVKMALNTLDYLGFIAENYVNVEGPLLEWMSPPIVKVWERLGPYIEDERQKRQEPDYYRSAFYIGKKCVDWRRKQGLKSEIIENGT